MNRRQRAQLARIRPTPEQRAALEQLEAIAEDFAPRTPHPMPHRPGEDRARETGAQLAARRRWIVL